MKREVRTDALPRAGEVGILVWSRITFIKIDEGESKWQTKKFGFSEAYEACIG